MRNFNVAGRLVTDPEIITPDWAVLHVDTGAEYCIQISYCGKQAKEILPSLKTGAIMSLHGVISISFRHDQTCIEFISRDAEVLSQTS